MSDLIEPGAIRRRAARVLVLDEADRLLLFRGLDPGDPDSGPGWFTVGGGVDPGESVLGAAAREVRGETGLVDVDLGPPVWVRDFEFRFEGVRHAQQEYLHVDRVTGASVDTGGFNDVERRSVLGHHWWSAAELASTADVVHPPQLAELLATALTGEVLELSG